MFGKIELENFVGLSSMPQKAASAWSILSDLVGASYKPLLYCGKQVVKGTNHYFIAELTLAIARPERHIVLLAINEYGGKYELVKESIEVIL